VRHPDRVGRLVLVTPSVRAVSPWLDDPGAFTAAVAAFLGS
jgi:pimeloyl-ACP methyl ester carboxylesterase